MEMGARVSEIGSLLGDPVRAPADSANRRPIAASGRTCFYQQCCAPDSKFSFRQAPGIHLIAVERQGKHKYYRLTNEQVAQALESLASIAPLRKEALAPSGRYLSQHRNTGLQFARSCYRHLPAVWQFKFTTR
jgi:hypothetical protein